MLRCLLSARSSLICAPRSVVHTHSPPVGASSSSISSSSSPSSTSTALELALALPSSFILFSAPLHLSCTFTFPSSQGQALLLQLTHALRWYDLSLSKEYGPACRAEEYPPLSLPFFPTSFFASRYAASSDCWKMAFVSLSAAARARTSEICLSSAARRVCAFRHLGVSEAHSSRSEAGSPVFQPRLDRHDRLRTQIAPRYGVDMENLLVVMNLAS